MTTGSGSAHFTVFQAHRKSLYGAAYRILGTVQDTEDAIQDTWVRWCEVDLQRVTNPGAYLVRSVSRAALNQLRTRRRRQEEYPGPWLPEPVFTESQPGPEDAAEIANEVSLALLVVLESLSPLERAAFVLRDVFELPYQEVSEVLDRPETAVRKLVSRAKARVRQGACRQPADPGAHQQLTELFLNVAQGTAPFDDLLLALTQEVVFTSDAGGRAPAALHPVRGIDNVLRLAAGILSSPQTKILEWNLALVNGESALAGYRNSEIDSVIWLEVEAGKVSGINVVRNPEKLKSFTRVTEK